MTPIYKKQMKSFQQEVFIDVFKRGGGAVLCRSDPILHAQTYAPYAYANPFWVSKPYAPRPPYAFITS